MKAIIATAVASALFFSLSAPAEATQRHYHKHHHRHHVPNSAINLTHGLPWCGAWMAVHKYGRNVRRLWLARAWAHEGSPAPGPAPHVLGVTRHHVFEVLEVVAPGKVLAISGNDGGAVRTRVRTTRGVIAWRYV